MLIYSHKITPRVRYIFNVLLGDMLGLEVSFTNEKESFSASEEAKISYSHSKIGDEIHFKSQVFVFLRMRTGSISTHTIQQTQS
jgi:hypothetical protein